MESVQDFISESQLSAAGQKTNTCLVVVCMPTEMAAAVVSLCCVVLVLVIHARAQGNVFVGRYMEGYIEDETYELTEMHGVMTVEDAVEACNDNLGCTAFSYIGAEDEEDEVDVSFYTVVGFESIVEESEWTTYVKFYHVCCSGGEQLRNLTVKELKVADNISRISCDISPKDFERDYVLPRKPVILTGCAKDWPAMEKWNLADILNRFDNDTLWHVDLDGEGMENGTVWEDVKQCFHTDEFCSVADTLEINDTRLELLKEYKVPRPLPVDLYALEKTKFPPDHHKMRWFFVDKAGTGTDINVGPYYTDTWNTLLRGHKWWVVYPDDVPVEDIECDEDCSEDVSTKSWFHSVLPKSRNFEWEGEKLHEVVQYPGETIYIPYAMPYTVLNVDDSVAISQNFATRGNLKEIWEAVVETHTEFKSEYWRRMYYNHLDNQDRKTVRESGIWPNIK